MKVTTLPHDDWKFALRHAWTFYFSKKLYPGDSGKRIKDIKVERRVDEFVITFEDGSQEQFNVGEDA
jgi:hypothetical protein